MTEEQNYFELFQLPIRIPVDNSQLTKQYQQLQRLYHPDNFATASESEKLEKLQQSTYINDAFQTLKDPLLCAEYWLSLHGFVVSAEQNIINDTDFLFEQFTLREQLDSIEQQTDLDLQETQLFEFSTSIQVKWKASYACLIDAIEETNFPLAQIQINTLRFLNKLQQQIERLEDHCSDKY